VRGKTRKESVRPARKRWVRHGIVWQVWPRGTKLCESENPWRFVVVWREKRSAWFHDMHWRKGLGLQIVSCRACSLGLCRTRSDSRERYSRTARHDSISMIASSMDGTPSLPPIEYRLKNAYRKDNPAMNEKWLCPASVLLVRSRRHPQSSRATISGSTPASAYIFL
jgi:hypothetical protein